MNKPHQHPQNVKACYFGRQEAEAGQLTFKFLLMKTSIFKTIAVSLFFITLLLLSLAVANMVTLALN